MRKSLLLVLMSACCSLAADRFVFSSDGVTAGSSERELPSQGYDRVTGRVVVGLHARTDEERAACGWWRVIPTDRPEAQSNEVWRVGGYAFGGGCATQVWACAWRKVTPRRFSKLKVVAALMQAGVWPQVKQWIEANGLYDLYLAAQDFAEDNEYFTQGKAQLQAALGWTDAQVETLLKECEL